MSEPLSLPCKYQIDQKVKLTSVAETANPCTVTAVIFRKRPLGIRVEYDLLLGGPGGMRIGVLETALAEWPES